MQISRMLGDKERSLMFRGWSRLCLHSASVNAVEGALATTTAAARAVRAEAVEKEATAASEQAEACRRAATASAEAAAVTEQARQEATGVVREAAKLTDRADELENSLKQEQGLRAGMLVRRATVDHFAVLRVCAYDSMYRAIIGGTNTDSIIVIQ